MTDEQPPKGYEAFMNEIKARADAATAGPWEYRQAVGRPGVWVNGCKVAAVEAPNHPPATQLYGRRNNAEFIAHARTDIPLLLEEIKRLKAMLATKGARSAEGG